MLSRCKVEAFHCRQPHLPLLIPCQAEQRLSGKGVRRRAAFQRLERCHHLVLVLSRRRMLQEELRRFLVVLCVSNPLDAEYCSLSPVLVVCVEQFSSAGEYTRIPNLV